MSYDDDEVDYSEEVGLNRINAGHERNKTSYSSNK
jgi:hypothetical protein